MKIFFECAFIFFTSNVIAGLSENIFCDKNKNEYKI